MPTSRLSEILTKGEPILMLAAWTFHKVRERCLTKKAEPPPTRGVNRDSGTASANGGWLRRLVRHHGFFNIGFNLILTPPDVISPYWSGIAIIRLGAPNGYTILSEFVT